MYCKNYRERIEKILSKSLKDIIGDLDIEEILKEDIESLFYIFPLIERIVLEICKFYPEIDIEEHKQGFMRTLNSILTLNLDMVLPQDILLNLNKYFARDGLRNKLFHANGENVIEIDTKEINEIVELLVQLIEILDVNLKKMNKSNFEFIEYLD